ncbi:MAG: penicillin-binding protein 2, partial [Clostridia bacterium]|nr:penicillin-binding protein 2 [Clostridia bacterium]
YIYQEMGNRSGAVVVMNYKTGAVLASVSKESFDISKAQELAKQEYSSGESFFLNKAANGKYPPGSTFKLITTASALENIPNALSKTYESSSEISIGGSKVTNFDRESHGTIDLKKALEVSSNTYFAQLSKELGKSSLTATAESFGFNKDFMFDDVIMSTSKYTSGKNDNNLAWSAVGQHEDLVTPMHMCMIVSAIANDGAMMEPKTLYSVKDSLGINIYNMRSKKIAQPISPQIASQMQSLMIGVVENGTGRNAAVDGLTIGGKTGSAETGSSTHAWFVGYIQSDQTPYAVAIILENAGTGGKNAAPLAKKIFSKVANK